jgi:serine/threonine protein kinase
LYSRRAQTWKIADFGLTTEGTSKHPIIGVNATGTPSYRAPELIRGVDYVYTNKVDLWALGCIFYELLFGRKAFAGDYAVREYSASPELLGIPVTSAILGNISSWREAIKAVLHATLDKDPSKRGSAHEIRIHLTALSAVIFTSSKPQNGRTTNNDGIHETMVDESVHGMTTEYICKADSRKRR